MGYQLESCEKVGALPHPVLNIDTSRPLLPPIWPVAKQTFLPNISRNRSFHFFLPPFPTFFTGPQYFLLLLSRLLFLSSFPLHTQNHLPFQLSSSHECRLGRPFLVTTSRTGIGYPEISAAVSSFYPPSHRLINSRDHVREPKPSSVW